MFLCKSSKWRLLAQCFSAYLIDDRVDRHCAYGSNVLLWVTWYEPLFLTNHEPPVIWHEVDTACRGCHCRGEGLTSQKVLLYLCCVAADSAQPDPCLIPLLPYIWGAALYKVRMLFPLTPGGWPSHSTPLWIHMKPLILTPPPNQDRTPNQAPLPDHPVHALTTFPCVCGVITSVATPQFG